MELVRVKYAGTSYCWPALHKWNKAEFEADFRYSSPEKFGRCLQTKLNDDDNSTP